MRYSRATCQGGEPSGARPLVRHAWATRNDQRVRSCTRSWGALAHGRRSGSQLGVVAIKFPVMKRNTGDHFFTSVFIAQLHSSLGSVGGCIVLTNTTSPQCLRNPIVVSFRATVRGHRSWKFPWAVASPLKCGERTSARASKMGIWASDTTTATRQSARDARADSRSFLEALTECRTQRSLRSRYGNMGGICMHARPDRKVGSPAGALIHTYM
jgi:hypothetical protein